VGANGDETFICEEHRLKTVASDVVKKPGSTLHPFLHLPIAEKLPTAESIAAMVETTNNPSELSLMSRRDAIALIETVLLR